MSGQIKLTHFQRVQCENTTVADWKLELRIGKLANYTPNKLARAVCTAETQKSIARNESGTWIIGPEFRYCIFDLVMIVLELEKSHLVPRSASTQRPICFNCQRMKLALWCGLPHQNNKNPSTFCDVHNILCFVLGAVAFVFSWCVRREPCCIFRRIPPKRDRIGALWRLQ